MPVHQLLQKPVFMHNVKFISAVVCEFCVFVVKNMQICENYDDENIT